MRKSRARIYSAPPKVRTFLNKALDANWTYTRIRNELIEKFAFRIGHASLSRHFKSRQNQISILPNTQQSGTGSKTVSIHISGVPANAALKISATEEKE